MEKNGIKQEFTGDQAGVTSKVTIKNTDVPLSENQVEFKVNGKSRKQASEFSQSEIAEMFFDMLINHRMMELRIEKLETLLSNVPQADSKLSEYMMKAGTVEGRLQKIERRLNVVLSKGMIKNDTVEKDTI